MTEGHSLIVGLGEVGQALEQTLMHVHKISSLDIPTGPIIHIGRPIDVMHICFPYSKEFIAQVQGYQVRFRPRYTVIHSTVPVGTCSTLGVHHSPVRGSHPKLAESMRMFTTYLAPGNNYLVDYFTQAGMKVSLIDKPEETEAGKLWELATYAWNIMLEKEIHEYCEAQGLDFDVVYRSFAESYNQGYSDMGMGHFVKPVLSHVPGPIGGHCVLPGCEMLDDELITSVVLGKVLA